MDIKNKFNKRKLLYYLLLLVSVLFFYYRHQIDADEGVVLNGAWNLFNNLTLYYDFFEITAPGSFYLVYWLFKLFGVSYQVANIASLLILWGSAIGIYKIMDSIHRTEINYLFPFFFIISLTPFPIINHNLHNVFFLIWSVYLFLQALKHNNKYYFLTAGALGSLAVMFLQQKGLALGAASGLFLFFLVIKKKCSIKNMLLYGLSLIGPLTLLFIKWPPSLLYNNLVHFPGSTYWEVNQMPYFSWFAFFLILIYFVIFIKNKKVDASYLLFVQFWLLLSAIPLPDHYHLFLIIFPLLALTPYLFTSNPTVLTKTLIIVFILKITFNPITYLTKDFQFFYSYKNETSKQQLFEYLNQTCVGQYLYSGPFAPGLYFELQKRNATSFSFLIEKQSTPEQFNQALEEFKDRAPSCAILFYYPNINNKFGHRGNNVLESYIRQNYYLAFRQDYIYIYHQ